MRTCPNDPKHGTMTIVKRYEYDDGSLRQAEICATCKASVSYPVKG